MTTDFSGQHKHATYDCTSFLLANLGLCAQWETMRSRLRADALLGDRRMSFKSLGDRKRRDALPAFLRAANSIPGILLTFAVNKTANVEFTASAEDEPEHARYSHWKPAVFKKLLFTTHLAGVLLAGLSAPGQNVLWFIDEDDIVANSNRVCEATGLTAGIIGNYIPHSMGHFRLGNTSCDVPGLLLEDFAALPDLVAGALCELLALGSLPRSPIAAALPERLTAKSRVVLKWCALAAHEQLSNVVVVLEPGDAGRLSVACLEFVRYSRS